jgi:hypothetical protein
MVSKVCMRLTGSKVTVFLRLAHNTDRKVGGVYHEHLPYFFAVSFVGFS